MNFLAWAVGTWRDGAWREGTWEAYATRVTGSFGGPWKKKHKKAQEQELARFKEEQLELRALIERAVDPIREEKPAVVVTMESPELVTIAPAKAEPVRAAPVKIPVPPQFDAQMVVTEIRAVLTRIEIKIQEVQTKKAFSDWLAAVELKDARRKREEEFLLMMV